MCLCVFLRRPWAGSERQLRAAPEGWIARNIAAPGRRCLRWSRVQAPLERFLSAGAATFPVAAGLMKCELPGEKKCAGRQRNDQETRGYGNFAGNSRWRAIPVPNCNLSEFILIHRQKSDLTRWTRFLDTKVKLKHKLCKRFGPTLARLLPQLQNEFKCRAYGFHQSVTTHG